MSRMKLFLDVVSDLRSLADSLQAVADAMTQDEPEQTGKEAKSRQEQKAAGKKTAKSVENAEPESLEGEKPPLKLEQVRAVLAEKSRAGHTAEVKALLLKHGADKLSDIDSAEYPALLADAEVL